MSDYNFLLESRLSPGQFQVLTHLSRIAAALGLNLYLVGGAVRDLTYGQLVIRDLDFAVEGSPQKILRVLNSGRSAGHHHPGGPRIPGSDQAALVVEHLHSDARLNLVEVSFTNGVQTEIAMSRTEIYSKPGRGPEISAAMIFDDLKRRDFSVNAMAVSLHPNSRGLLLDPTNGAADIEKRELRVLYSRSFLEDPSRIYRLLRLGLRLKFKPEQRTKNLLDAALENRVWEGMDPEQQSRELRAILQEENSGRVLKMLAKRGLLAGLDRKLSSAKLPYERFARIRSVVRTVPGTDPFLLNFHCLVQKLGSGQKDRLVRKIIVGDKARKLALNLDRDAGKLAAALGSSRAALPSHVFTLLSARPQPLLLFLLAHYPQKKIQNRVKNYLFRFLPVRARLPRAELRAMGMEPGPKFEKILESVFFDQLDGKIKTHQQLVKALRTLSGIKPPPPKASKAAAGAQRAKKK